MLGRILFLLSVSVAIIVVLLLAFLSPVPQKKVTKKNDSRKHLELSLYFHPTHFLNSPLREFNPQSDNHALIFHHQFMEGPQNNSRVLGKAQGFIVTGEHPNLRAAFNMVYLTFDTPEFVGSLCVEEKFVKDLTRVELLVVGGTGSFAFARGTAVLAKTFPGFRKDASFYLNLSLSFHDH